MSMAGHAHLETTRKFYLGLSNDLIAQTRQASGLSVRQFCKREGLQEPTFYSWRKKLTGNDTESENLDTLPFIEVAMPQNASAVMELLLTSGNTLRIPAGVDSATLSMVLSVARAAGLC
jgi:hypothetical protein